MKSSFKHRFLASILRINFALLPYFYCSSIAKFDDSLKRLKECNRRAIGWKQVVPVENNLKIEKIEKENTMKEWIYIYIYIYIYIKKVKGCCR